MSAIAATPEAHPALLAIAACLGAADAPRRFRAWLREQPPDVPCVPGGAAGAAGAASAAGFAGGYWQDPVDNPLGRWLKAATGRGAYVQGDRWRLLAAVEWHPLPEWAGAVRAAFADRSRYLPECRGTAQPVPTPALVLRLLQQAFPLIEGEPPEDEAPEAPEEPSP